MNILIKFHKTLQKFTDCKEITLDINSVKELQLALCSTFPKLRQYVNWLYNNSSIEVNECICALYNDYQYMPDIWKHLDHFPEDIEILYITPCIYGANRDILPIIIGIILIIGSIYTAGALAPAGAGLQAGFSAGIAGAAAKAALSVGINLLIVGIVQLILKPPEPAEVGTPEGSQRKNSLFGPLQNTIDTGTPIPLIFGEHRTAGHFISGYINTIEREKEEVLNVGDLF